MFNNIKSPYMKNIIFSYLYEKNKLEIIKYNKSLQNILRINLINYKFWSEKYIIFETKEKGKEYRGYDGKLIYEVEYKNGKKQGKYEKYLDNGKLEFVGEYFNGKINGNVKEYYDNGQLKFEGEYLNGKRWDGKGYNHIGF